MSWLMSDIHLRSPLCQKPSLDQSYVWKLCAILYTITPPISLNAASHKGDPLWPKGERKWCQNLGWEVTYSLLKSGKPESKGLQKQGVLEPTGSDQDAWDPLTGKLPEEKDKTQNPRPKVLWKERYLSTLVTFCGVQKRKRNEEKKITRSEKNLFPRTGSLRTWAGQAFGKPVQVTLYIISKAVPKLECLPNPHLNRVECVLTFPGEWLESA